MYVVINHKICENKTTAKVSLYKKTDAHRYSLIRTTVLPTRTIPNRRGIGPDERFYWLLA